MTFIRQHKFTLFLLIIFFASTNQSFAQHGLGKLLHKAKKALHKTGTFRPGTVISTSLADSLPSISFLQDEDFDSRYAKSIQSFNLKPGYYKGKIRSYCLHAGAYSPSSGDGYQLASFKGSKTSLIQSILRNSAEHPDIPQHDVQTLIWGIEAGTKFSDYPKSFQIRVKPLLSVEDIANMEINSKLLANKLLPDDLRSLANTYRSFQDKIIAGEMNYDKLEKIAVKSGVAPVGPGSTKISKGKWSYIGDGFLLRTYPKSYPTTNIELYRPSHLNIIKDSEGRITSVKKGDNTIEIQYNDSPGQNVFHATGEPKIPIWRFKQVTFKGPSPQQKYTAKNTGWIFRGDEKEAASILRTLQKNPLSSKGETKTGPQSEKITYKSILDGLDRLEKHYKQTKKLYNRWSEIEKAANETYDATHIRPPEYYLNKQYANQRISEGLRVALNPLDIKGKQEWLFEHFLMIRDLWYYSICALSGGCSEANNPEYPKIWDFIAQPGNSSLQRLGLSPYIKKN